MSLIPAETCEQHEVELAFQGEKIERLCLDFDQDCVLHETPPFGSYRRCWDYDRSTGFCPFCLPKDVLKNR
ncbi:MAG: hypothetical protein U9P14_11710 [Gemmatimonadota bacterium]|nr:hypothetical protein [Gemmatimonadota bacterium]